MFDTVFHTNLDIFLIALPLLGVLALGFFRLDSLFAKPARIRPRRPASGVGHEGRPIFCDTDARRQALRPLRK